MKYHTYLGDTISWTGAGFYWFSRTHRVWLKTTRKFNSRVHWVERDEIE